METGETKDMEHTREAAEALEVEETGALLEAEQVSYVYGDYKAVSGVSFTIEPGELVALAGRNGAGKSTLLRCLAGWTQPTGGEVRIRGVSLARAEQAARGHMVFVPDVPPFYYELTAWEHLHFVARAHAIDEWEEDAAALMERFALTRQQDASPFALSRGMRYKLAVAMAMLVEPSLMMLDEPFGPLDPVSAGRMWDDLSGELDEDTAILLSSHQMPHDAQPDRYLIMEDGVLIADGSPEGLKKELRVKGDSLEELMNAALRRRLDETGNV